MNPLTQIYKQFHSIFCKIKSHKRYLFYLPLLLITACDQKVTLPGEITVRFLDVGQGDSILISSPEGKHFLIDGGRNEKRMAALLKDYHIHQLEAIVATHADFDHIAGLSAAALLKPKIFFNNRIDGTTKTWNKVVDALHNSGAVFTKANGQVFELGSVRIHIIAPPQINTDEQNNNSIGTIVEFGQFRVLMTGDSEKEETTAWLEQNPKAFKGPFQIYKSIHHGAANGDHQEWLDYVKPANVIISVGKNNYGHPTQSALQLYKKNNISIYRTDQQGTITIVGTSNGAYRIHSEK